MIVSVRAEEGVSSGTVDLVREATTYFFEKLLPAPMRRDLRVHVTVGGRRFLPGRTFAEAGPSGEDSTRRRPRDYSMKVSTVHGRLTMLQTIAHECAHVRQFRLGHMRAANDHVWWHGRRYAVDRHRAAAGAPSSWEDYYDRPWEIEANGCERGLMNNFLYDRHLRLYRSWVRNYH